MNNLFTFAICAYKNSPYLEEAILSAKHQTIPAEILIATSTPSDYIAGLAEKYGIPYFINSERKGIASDWNFALSCIKTPYGAILHQDDIYFPQYAESVVKMMNKNPDTKIVFTDYGDLLADGKIHVHRLYLWVKRCMLWPFYLKHAHRSHIMKISAVAFGNAICCPAVAYNLSFGNKVSFDSTFSVNLDWDMWLRLADQNGAFVFIPHVLMAHRIADIMETASAISDHRREKEDRSLFLRIWGKRIATLFMMFYRYSYCSNVKKK